MSEVACLRALLRLSRLAGIEEVLDDVLGTLLEHTGAQYGYVEVLNERASPPTPTWRARARSDEHIEWIQAVISRGIIACARIDGRTVATASAIDDARFADLGSVREYEIGSVVCSPFDGFWTSGVIYLQGRPMVDLAATCEIAELAASQVGLLAEHFRRQLPPALTLEVELDSVKRHAIEELLRRYDWNLSAVQRETGLSRKHIREFMRGKRH